MAGVYGNMMAIPRNGRGGALPEYQGGNQVYTPGSGVSARLSDSAAGISRQTAAQTGQGLRDLARGIDHLGAMAGQFVEFEDRRARAEAQAAYAQFQDEMTAERGRLSRLHGADAVGVGGKPDVVQQSHDWRQKTQAALSDGLKSERARNYFNQLASSAGTNFSAWAGQHRERELGRYEDVTFDAALSSEMQSVASNPTDTDAAFQSLGRIRALIRQRGMRQGWSPEVEQEQFRKATDNIIMNSVQTKLAEGDVATAGQLMATWGGQLSAQGKARLQSAYDSGVYRQFNAFLGAGDYESAERVLRMGVGGTGKGTLAPLGSPENLSVVNTGNMPGPTKQAIINEATAQNVPPELALAVAMTESDGNHGISDSKAGAQGLFQLMPGTAKELGVNARDMAQNIRGGVSYLKKMLDKYGGNYELALAAYNWGPGNVDKWLASGRGVSGQDMPAETRAYARTVQNFMEGKTRDGKSAGLGGGAVSDPTIRAAMSAKTVALSAMKDLQATADMDYAARKEDLYRRAESVPAGPQRNEYIRTVNSELAFHKDREDAEDGRMIADTINLGVKNGWTDVDWEKNLATMQANGVRPAVIDGVQKWRKAEDKKLSAAKRQQQEQELAAYKKEQDAYYAQYGVVNPDTKKLAQLLKAGKITLDQYNDTLEYQKRGGAFKNINQTNMDKLWKQVTGKNNGCPENMVKAAWMRFGGETGRVVSEDEIKMWMAQTYTAEARVSRSWWGGTDDLADALAEGKTILGLVVPDSELPRVKAMMRAQGATEEQVNNPVLQEQAWAKMNGVL